MGLKKWASIVAVIVVLGLVGSQLSITKTQDGKRIITLGYVADAAGDLDYTIDGTDDDVQFQAALNALPAAGGELIVVSATTINFSATVTRAIDNVTITGTGRGTYFAHDGATDLFTAGGNNWTFRDLRTDAGDIGMGATTGWSWENVTINATYYAYRTDDATTAASWNIPSGRGATIFIAANDATAAEKSQADYLCDGTADQVQIQAAIDGLPTQGGLIKLSSGYFSISAGITVDVTDTMIQGMGQSTHIQTTNAMADYVFTIPKGTHVIWFNNMLIGGSIATGQATGGAIHATDILYLDLESMTTANFPEHDVLISYDGGGGFVASQIYFHDLDQGECGEIAWSLDHVQGYIDDAWIEFNQGGAIEILNSRDLNATNLNLLGNGLTGSATTLTVTDSYNIKLQGNAGSPRGTGVLFNGTTHDSTCSMTIRNAGQDASDTYYAFMLDGTAHDNVFNGSIAYSDSANKIKYGIYETANCYNNSWVGGGLWGYVTAGYSSLSAKPIYVRNLNSYIAFNEIRGITTNILQTTGDTKALWTFIETFGTSVLDYSRYAHNLTASATVAGFTPYIIGRLPMLTFNGSTQYLSIADDADFTFGNSLTDHAFSIIAVCNITNTANDREIISKYNAQTSQREWYLSVAGVNDKLYLSLVDESAGKLPDRHSDAAITMGSTIVIIATYDGTGGATAMNGVVFYVDGSVIASTAANDAGYVAMEDTTASVIVGGETNPAGAIRNYYQGGLGMLAVVNKALSADEAWVISQMLKAQMGN